MTTGAALTAYLRKRAGAALDERFDGGIRDSGAMAEDHWLFPVLRVILNIT